MCLSDTSDFYDPVANPLIQPCHCNSFIHVMCLRKWLDQKKRVERLLKQVKVVFEKFCCEICQCPYPIRFKTTNKLRHSLLDFELQSDQNYLVLESVPKPDSAGKHSKTVHLFTTRSLWMYKVGRSSKADMSINEITISRAHAEIKFDGLRFTL